VRVLDIADVAQRDWHGGQILLCSSPATKVDHIVLIDFASTTQTWELHEANYIENYYGLLGTLLGRKAAFGSQLVWEHFGKPDDWDPIQAFVATCPKGEAYRAVAADNMFPFIS
jgi:hypothetical protein